MKPSSARTGRVTARRQAGKPKGLAELEAQDAMFAALAHRSRRTIIAVLAARGGQMTSGEIARRFDCAWPTTTRHLRVLEQAGLVSVSLRGRERVYTLDRRRLGEVAGGWIARFTG
jgi:DNA-binding transcriptional ArsR family regulator